MFKREIKINLKSLLIWLVIILSMYLLVYSIYPSIMNSTSTQQIKEMMTIFPEDMLKVFNMDIVGIESAYGWFKTEGYIFLTLIGGMYAAILGSTILLKEESEKTIEFLYSKPISRNKIITAKIMAGVTILLIFTFVVTIFNFIGLNITGELNISEYFMIALIPLLLYLLLFFIGMFISTFMKKTKTAMGIGIGLVFITYFMQIIGGMSKEISFIKDISLFEFVSSRYIILNQHLDTNYLIIGMIIIVLCLVGIYIRYNKKELV